MNPNFLARKFFISQISAQNTSKINRTVRTELLCLKSDKGIIVGKQLNKTDTVNSVKTTYYAQLHLRLNTELLALSHFTEFLFIKKILTLKTKEQNFYYIFIAPTLEVKTSQLYRYTPTVTFLQPTLHGCPLIYITTTTDFHFYQDKKSQVKTRKRQINFILQR